MRIAVMGSGGTGGFFGALLARAGQDVTFIARGAHLAALRAHGLTIKSRLVGDFALPVQATDEPHQIGHVDLVLFCVKTYDSEAAAKSIRSLLHAETVVLPLQNGIDAAERLGGIVGPAHVIAGVAYVTSSVTAPGTVTQTGGAGKIVMGELGGGTNTRMDALLQVIESAGIPAQIHHRVETAIWDKFAFICAFGGITALTRLPIGPILASDDCRVLFDGVMQEVITLSASRGVSLSADTVERGMTMATSFEPWARGSLYHDLAAGRRLELDALNGAVVRLSREYHLATPLNFAVFAALQPYAGGTPSLPTESAPSA